jgi:hypothetical protein
MWFWAIFLIAHDKRGISATYVARKIACAKTHEFRGLSPYTQNEP